MNICILHHIPSVRRHLPIFSLHFKFDRVTLEQICVPSTVECVAFCLVFLKEIDFSSNEGSTIGFDLPVFIRTSQLFDCFSTVDRTDTASFWVFLLSLDGKSPSIYRKKEFYQWTLRLQLNVCILHQIPSVRWHFPIFSLHFKFDRVTLEQICVPSTVECVAFFLVFLIEIDFSSNEGSTIGFDLPVFIRTSQLFDCFSTVDRTDTASFWVFLLSLDGKSPSIYRKKDNSFRIKLFNLNVCFVPHTFSA